MVITGNPEEYIGKSGLSHTPFEANPKIPVLENGERIYGISDSIHENPTLLIKGGVQVINGNKHHKRYLEYHVSEDGDIHCTDGCRGSHPLGSFKATSDVADRVLESYRAAGYEVVMEN